jgi:hypothetical protein
MTIINKFDIDNVKYTPNGIKNAIITNQPIEEKLHVIIVCSNPSQYASRYILTREFIKRIATEEKNVLLYVVELSYDTKFYITDVNNKRHLRLNAKTPLWHKENMINIGVQRLLPDNWKAMAWIDADIEFENPSWALDTLKVLNGSYDVVQLFSHACNMDIDKITIAMFNSFGYCYVKNTLHKTDTANTSPHTGYAWAITREAYDKMDGLYDLSILGGGDSIMAKAFIGLGKQAIHPSSHVDWFETIKLFEEKVKNFKIGYVPGVIRHYWHGSSVNRKYMTRHQILVRWNYSPYTHIEKNSDGILIPTSKCPKGLLVEILQYGKDRNEDECRK